MKNEKDKKSQGEKKIKQPGQAWNEPKKSTMYRKPHFSTTKMNINKGVQGETIEMKMERVLNNKEPIKDGAKLIYTERKDGVNPAHNIRTDRFVVAVEGMDKRAKSYQARREERIKGSKGASEVETKKDGGPESIQGKPTGGTDGNSK